MGYGSGLKKGWVNFFKIFRKKVQNLHFQSILKLAFGK